MTEHDSHPVELHTHTLTFTDNDGQSYSFDHDCPAGLEPIKAGFERTGAASVNDLCVDGKPLPFENVARILGVMDLLDLLGKSYMTGENLAKLLIGMGTQTEGD